LEIKFNTRVRGDCGTALVKSTEVPHHDIIMRGITDPQPSSYEWVSIGYELESYIAFEPLKILEFVDLSSVLQNVMW
jgi:hypothetical protein